jgi:hypothetical protein
MMNLGSFTAKLQERLTSDDQTWSYQVPQLPCAQRINSAKLVKSITLDSSKSSKSGVYLRLVDAPSNRVTWTEPLDRFVLLSLEGFKLIQPSSFLNDPPKFYTARESAEYASKMLKTGIELNGIRYHFFGHSNSQLKSRSCFLYAASKEAIKAKVEAMGDFSKLKSVGKKAKRIGLLFSSAEMGIRLTPERCEDIQDIEDGDFTFTDGCGLIASGLARKVVQQRQIIYRNKRYLPSVFQIRYRGYKGVLTLDPTLTGRILVEFRASMKKFRGGQDLTLSVVDFSKVWIQTNASLP